MDTPVTHRAQFHGDGGSLFVIHLRNLLLTIITFGIYTFWARTEVRKYLYSQTAFAGDRFTYHGTGKELLIGWVKAMLVYGIAYSAPQVLLGGSMGQDGQIRPGIAIAAMLLLVVLMVIVVPFALLGSRRYRLSRTSWRGIRFSFRGSYKELLRTFAPGLLLSWITLGFYYPVWEINMRRYLVHESRFGSEPFEFDGDAREVYGGLIGRLLLSFITLGIAYPWYLAYKHRYYWAHTKIAGARFESTVTGGDLFGLLLTSALLVIFTLGFGYAWAQARTMRFHTERLVMHGAAAFDGVVQQMDAAGATGDQLADMFDVELVGTDLFGL